MAVRRTSTVAAEARAAARRRQAEQQEKERERREKIGGLAEEHAVALALAGEVDSRFDAEVARLRARADEEVATHRLEADKAAVQLLELETRVEAVADLLGVTAAEVRASRRRVRGGGGEAVSASAGAEESSVEDAGGTTPMGAAAPAKPARGEAEGASAAA